MVVLLLFSIFLILDHPCLTLIRVLKLYELILKRPQLDVGLVGEIRSLVMCNKSLVQFLLPSLKLFGHLLHSLDFNLLLQSFILCIEREILKDI